MARTLRFGRFGAALAIVALVLTSLGAPSATHAAPAETKATIRTPAQALPMQDLGHSTTLKTAGEIGSIELNVDDLDDGENASVFTFGTDLTVKAGFGNRFSLTTDQTPFALKQAAAFLVETTDGVGFEAGQMVGITIMVDASGSGDINDAVVVLNGSFTLDQLGFIAVGLPEPIIVKQGDIYIIFTDLSDDADDTVIPVLLEENGGVGDGRGYVSLSTGTPNPVIQSGYLNLRDDLSTPVLGNCVVRGFGDPAVPGDLVTGGMESFDGTLSTPTGLMATGTSTVTLSWTAPNLPPPPTPTPVSEAEANDSPATAQNVGTNVAVAGRASSGDPGAAGGFGGDDVEDWYGFTLSAPTSVQIDLTGFGATDFDLLLYNSSGPFTSDDAVAVSGGGAGEEEHIAVAVLPAGTYVVAVTAFDPDVPSATNYTLTIIAAPKVNRYNIYCGAADGFAVGPETFFGAIPGDQTSFAVLESAAGAYYRVTAVIGAVQTNASNSASGSPCEGGPTFASVKAKRNGNGKITFKGATGSLTGIQILINGVGFASAPKVKGTKVTQKGPLANGQTVGQACPAGCTATILTAAGCSSVVIP